MRKGTAARDDVDGRSGIPFPDGDCAISAQMRAMDWSTSPLGPVAGWSPTLKGAVSLILPAQAQIVMFWGPEFVALYNAAYAPTIGNKHPHALGRPAREYWTELWDDLEPLLRQARDGETVVAKDRPFRIERKGYIETVYFDISYSPARNEAGEVEGVVCIVDETTDRVLALQRLRDSEAQFRTLAEAMPALVWTATPEGNLDWFNPHAYAYTGAPTGALDGQAWTWVTHPDDLARAAGGWAAAVKAGGTYTAEFRLRRADGVYRWHLARAVPIRDEGGAILRWLGTTTDIEDQKAATEALAHMNETLERQVAERTRERDSAWNNAQDLLLVVSPEGVFRAANPAWRTILGWEPEELIGKHYLDLTHPDDRELKAKALAHASREALNNVEARCRHRDGSYRWIGWVAAPEGGLIYAAGRDVTREREQAQALERSEARLRSVFNTSYQHQGLLSPEGIVLDANPTSLAGIRARREDVVGKLFWETPWFTATPGMPDLVRTALPLVRAGRTVRREVIINLPAGRHIFDFSLRPVLDGAGKVIAIVPEAMDVTARHAAEEQLRQAQKMEALGQLTGGIAHDFNNMLMGISGAVELIRRRVDAGRPQGLDRYLDAASTAVQRAAALTHRLLAFARRQSLDTRPQDVNALVVNFADVLRRTLGSDITLETRLAPSLWPALTDANQFESALLNLALNARDAMPGGGHLTITTANQTLGESSDGAEKRTAGDYVVVQVSDTGTGMVPSVREKAFDPFFTTKPIGQGTGLGLSMIYGYARQSGGHVHIDSEVGQGTTVTLTLRRAPPEETEAPAPEPAAPPGLGETVLVVEDDSTVRMLVIDVLEDLGYRHIEAADARGAIPHLESRRAIDLLVTDVGLPNMNGRQLAEIARQFRPRLKVLFITGYAENATARAGFLQPGMDILPKPFTLEALGAKVREMLGA
ncbi:hybrid sensor histidine kinase/response regulator [Nitrospirillum viridazoti]|uniref:hybrid sensor histidine kinase/response regulator n=1 Tax=Nitrospirillum viridazoti TaxID=3144925 RepID=UPI0011AB05AD|nr:PAS domain-containing sensor histidine kinase [Nitrospirillum amazonense]